MRVCRRPYSEPCSTGLPLVRRYRTIRSVNHIIEAGKIGADVITAPPSVIKSMASHPLTDKGLAQFNADWAKTGQKIGK